MRQRRAIALGLAAAVLWAWELASVAGAAPVTVGWKVLLPDGKPAAGAKVLVRVVQTGRLTVKDTWVETGDDGAFSADVDIEPGAWDEPGAGYGFVLIDMAGHALLAHEAPYGNLRKPSELKLSADFEVSGQVVGPDGQPVPAADVSVLHLKPLSQDVAAGPWGLNVPRWGAQYLPLTTKAGADGAFKLRGITADMGTPMVGVTASAPGLQGFPSESYVRPEGPPLKVHLKPTLSVSGRVVQALTGEPVAGARVRPFAHPADQAATRAYPETDAEGRFTIADLYPVEKLFVEATHPNLAKAWAELPGKESSTDVVLKLRPWATLAGRLVDQDTGENVTLAGVWVQATWDPGRWEDDHSPRVEAGRTQVQTDAEGRFAVQTAVGETRVTASGQGYREAAPLVVEVPLEGAEAAVPVRKR